MVNKNIPVGLVALFLSVPVSAVKLWATTYNNHAVTTLDLSGRSLTVVDKNLDCGEEPTWLTLDKANSLLYCLNEGWGGSASLTSYQVNSDDSIETLDILPVLKSPVASSVYGPNNGGLAVAHYDTSAFTSYDVSDPSNLALAQNETYTLPNPPSEGRQTAPHLHHTIVDPTGQFILSPDLGADLIRIYKVGSGIAWTQLAPGVATKGSGPRHGAWIEQAGENYFYTLNELTNTITGYRAAYRKGGLTLTKFTDIAARGPGSTIPDTTSAAELVASPDGQFIIASLRKEGSLSIPAFQGKGKITSDPLITYKVGRGGKLTHVQTAPAGGMNPRGFSLNADGSLLASALQDDNRVVIIERNKKTGKLGKFVAHQTVGEGDGNGPNYVLFA